MTATRIEITLSENVVDAFAKAAAAGVDMTPAMRAISGMMVTFSQQNFLKQKSPEGVPWKKRRNDDGDDDGHLILVQSGDLIHSIKNRYDANSAEAGPERSGGAGVYARIHQLGGVIKAKLGKALATPFGFFKQIVMPARPYLGWNEAMGKRTLDILTRHIAKAYDAGGRGLPQTPSTGAPA